MREPLLSLPGHGWINLHFSLLPAWRGAAPVQRALIAGDAVTGASVFRLVAELDAGDVFATEKRSVGADETAGELLDALAASGAELTAGVVDAIGSGTAISTPQAGDPSFAPKLTIDDARLEWAQPTASVDARFRGVTPEPGAFTEVGGARLKVLEARPSDGRADLAPGVVRAEGRRIVVGTADGADRTAAGATRRAHPMGAADWWRGLGVDEAVAR